MTNLRAAFAPVLTLLICAGPASAQSPCFQTVSSSGPILAWKGGVETGSGPHPAMILFLIIVVCGIVKAIWDAGRESVRQADTRVIVFEDLKYPSNHHVPGVGYYHASHRQWFPLPWNELREGRGYYHGGVWHPEPSSEMEMTFPDPEHVRDVNFQWRRLNPEKMERILDDVERRGFGQAVGAIEDYSRSS